MKDKNYDPANNEANTFDLADRVGLYKEFKDNKISDENVKKFIDSIMTNYYLDNDNINFLTQNGLDMFSFNDNESCFCLSGLLFKDCCKAHMSKEKHEDYVTQVESLLNEKSTKHYQSFINKIYKKHLKIQQHDKCIYPDCDQQAVKNDLFFDINLVKHSAVSTNGKTPFESNYKMGTVFFKHVNYEDYLYYGLCDKHYQEIKSINLEDKNITEMELLKSNLSILGREFYVRKAHLMTLKEEFREYFNSIKEDGYKAYFVYNIRRVSNKLRASLNFYNDLKNDILANKLQKMEIIHYAKLPRQKVFETKDIIYPQVTPEKYEVVNSVNNALLDDNIALINMQKSTKKNPVVITYQKDNAPVKNFFSEYKDVIDGKQKFEESFISNIALILTDNIIFDQDYFYHLSKDTQVLYSALNKFRYENPNMGEEYIKMKFFAGFNRGNNFY